MPSLVLRLWMVLLALLLQVGSWRSEASSSDGAAPTAPPALGEFDAADDGSEELSAVDDSFGGEILAGAVPNWCSSTSSCRWYRWIDGLPPGGPPRDVPFKPPRG